jgi:Tfp pilus assembly protein PilF
LITLVVGYGFLGKKALLEYQQRLEAYNHAKSIMLEKKMDQQLTNYDQRTMYANLLAKAIPYIQKVRTTAESRFMTTTKGGVLLQRP